MFHLELKFLEKQMVVREAFLLQICKIILKQDKKEKLENVGSLWGSS